ncbi:hypothetical protein C1H46_012569 [Malus baccata]|uniref:Uncharacterized protein n=1 Tax=Malus baccata TaxID=106549 RepID=A0A540MSJ9_MALBA|nr:hypothetical protein C1H46_012569 [Malus baccata]
MLLSSKTISSEEQASIKESVPWHETFGALKNKFKNGARVLNLIEELLLQGETFIFCVDFKGVMVYSSLLDVLGMFFEKVGNADGNLRHLSPYLHGIVLEELEVLLLDMEHVPLLKLTEHRMLCWRDKISDLAALGMPIKSLEERLEKLHDTMFSLRLKKDKGILG